jgi:hypothetical protein
VLSGKSKAFSGRVATAELDLTPLVRQAPVERRMVSAGRAGADHVRVVADAFCDVVGVFRVEGGPLSIPFNGRAYCAHHYGFAPLAPDLDRWMWGTATFSDRAYSFHIARPRGQARPPHAHLLMCDATGIHEIDDPPVTFQGSRRAGWLLPYPSELNIGSDLRLRDPQVVDRSLFSLRVRYTASTGAGREATTAMCEITYPRRLRWPALGRLIERSIDRVDGELGCDMR